MPAPTIVTDKDIARLAFTEAGRASPVPLPSDMLEDAHYYVSQGYSILKNTGRRDPRVYGINSAKDAVVSYVKARILGVPVNSTEFPVLAQLWMHAAAIDSKVIKGTTTNQAERAVIDEDGLFITRNVQVGMLILNTTDSTRTKVTEVESETRLEVLADIFATGDKYEIRFN